MKANGRKIKKIFSTLVVAFAIISFWRGIWGLMDLYLFPNNGPLSLLISLIAGIIILYSTENLLEAFI